MAKAAKAIQICCLAAIRAYQIVLSPWVGQHCRFYPTCSHYAKEAFLQHGVLKGSWLSVCRVLRCHPFASGGVDPVPKNPMKSGN